MTINPPLIDSRRYSEMLQLIRNLMPFYTPEWKPQDDKEFGRALLHIFSHLIEDIISHLNRVPGKNFIAFLNMLGIELLPARSARVPVRFIPAPGTENGILIRENTGLIAQSTLRPPIELPFETEENLFAIRSALLDIVAIDPEKDAIFKPPSKFTELKLPPEPLATYRFQSFAAAGSNTFQLDRVEGIEENDILRIPPSKFSSDTNPNSGDSLALSNSEHLVVLKKAGNIITTEDKSSKDYPADTEVEKVTRFHLFDSKDWQEHILYLGHPDLFSIKNEAQFTVSVIQRAGTATGIEPLNLAWEYWGEKENEEEKDWWEFDIVADSSTGFSSDGKVILSKGKGEIKEEEINGVTSRWIRCRLKDKIPSTEPRRLPNFDSIKFLIESAGEPVPADQAFYNDTPLDVNLPFYPFGTEPRTLDRFQVASEEIFSKKGAEITVEIELDSGGILASPAAVVFEDSADYPISVFARGTGGRLLEVQLGGAIGVAEEWVDHEFPDETTIGFPNVEMDFEARPAVAGYSGALKRYVWVFCTADNGGLIELFCNGKNCEWIDHGRPKKDVKIKGDPSVVRSQVNQVKVFVTGNDGNLYSLIRDLSASKGKWDGQAEKPSGTSIVSTPEAVVSDDSEYKIIVLANGNDNSLYQYDGDLPSDQQWKKFSLPDAAVNSRPFAVIYEDSSNNYFAKVFVVDDKGDLRRFDTGSSAGPDNLGKPPSSEKIESSASGFLEKPDAVTENGEKEIRHIFVRADDKHLWERTDDDWIEHRSPAGAQLRKTPFAVTVNAATYRIYSASARNSIIERQIILPVTGTATLGSARSVTIEDAASDVDNAYKDMFIEILNPGGDVVDKKKITTYIGALRLVRVNSPWGIQLSDQFRYRIVNIVLEGAAISTTVQSVDLELSAVEMDNAYNDFEIEIASQRRKMISYDKGPPRRAIVDSNWGAISGPFDYTLYPDHGTGTAKGGTAGTIKLDDNRASNNDGAYAGLQVKMTSGSLSGKERKIKSYTGATKEAELFVNWPGGGQPSDGDNYQLLPVTGSALNIVNSTIRLAGGASTVHGAYNDNIIEITAGSGSGQIGTVSAYNGTSRVAIFDGLDATASLPEANSEYVIVKVVNEGQLGVATKYSITLDGNASARDDAYIGRRLSIVGEPPKVITDYFGIDRVARTDPPWVTVPDATSQYSIAGFELWNEFEDPSEIALAPELSWEYWNNLGWVAFREEEHKFTDGTRNLMISGDVKFILPEDIERVDVSGQESFWIRARIANGDYGKETFTLVETQIVEDGVPKKVIELVPSKSAIRPPLITSLTISYKLLEEQFPKTCLTFNNRNYIDQTDACQTESKWFPPFIKLEDKNKTVFLGFENAIEGGPIKILFAARELNFTEGQKPKMEWSFRTQNRWEPVSAEDATDGLIRQEILQMQIPRRFETLLAFGRSRYWVKGTLIAGKYDEQPVLFGIFPNTTWATQAETIQDEILGSSTGEEKQDFQFSKVSVLDGENVRVREVLSQEETAQLERDIGPDAILKKNDELDRVIGTWVLWKKVPYFFDSGPEDRHYKLDRAQGRIEFGDGVHGQIPPAGADNIQAISYQAGGGAAGNIQAGGIQSLSTAIAGVESVMNPVAADGGADKATVEEMLDIGPGMISHRRRAVTIEDFELLAAEASRKIKKVRCLPNINNNCQPETGWVTVIIVPESKDDQPQPSLVLRREVQRFLSERCDGLTADRDRINVIGPTYEPISVEVDVYAESIEVASEAESQVRTTLKNYFHPLTGGPEGNGWDFGRGLAASDIYVLLEGIPGVDHIENLQFVRGSQIDKQLAQISQQSLLASGNLEINMNIAGNV